MLSFCGLFSSFSLKLRKSIKFLLRIDCADAVAAETDACMLMDEGHCDKPQVDSRADKIV